MSNYFSKDRKQLNEDLWEEAGAGRSSGPLSDFSLKTEVVSLFVMHTTLHHKYYFSVDNNQFYSYLKSGWR